MNEPIFKISGIKRRLLKKELSLLKHSVKMFHFYNDVDTVYGGGIDEKETEELLFEKLNQIYDLEEKLAKKLIE